MTTFTCNRCSDESEPADCPDRHSVDDHGLCCMWSCPACQHLLEPGEL